MLMRNINLADQLITKTFGVKPPQITLKKFQVDKTKLLFVLDYGNFTVQFDIREKKIIHKFDGEEVKFNVQNDLYQKAQYIREELFNDVEDESQVTIFDNDTVIDAEFNVVKEDNEQLTIDGTKSLEMKSSDDDLEDLSDSEIEDEEDE